MLCVNQGCTKYYFLSLWYDSAWDWTLVSQTIAEHCKGDIFLEKSKMDFFSEFISMNVNTALFGIGF